MTNRLALAVLLFAAPALAAPGGKLSTLPLGTYECSLPGDVATTASISLEGVGFRIVLGSSYRTVEGRGTYLRTGENVVFTRGPMEGAKFTVESARTIARVDTDAGTEGMRCVRTTD